MIFFHKLKGHLVAVHLMPGRGFIIEMTFKDDTVFILSHLIGGA